MKTLTIDGIELTVTDDQVDQLKEQLTESEDSLETFVDCWKKVIKGGGFFINSGNIIRYHPPTPAFNTANLNLLPRKELARKVQLYIKLLVIAEALNDGEEGEEDHNYYVYRKNNNLIYGHVSSDRGGVDIVYKNKETAQKAIQIAGNIYHEFFNIK